MVICTAQVLINAMRKKDVAMEDISLLILDECHHTGETNDSAGTSNNSVYKSIGTAMFRLYVHNI